MTLLNPDGTASDELMHRLWTQESGYNPRAVSRAGAMGVGQFMPGTFRDVGQRMGRPADKNDPFDPEENKLRSRYHVNELLQKYKGDVGLALMGYNWGTGYVDKWLESNRTRPVPAETKNYLHKILGADGATATLRSTPYSPAPVTGRLPPGAPAVDPRITDFMERPSLGAIGDELEAQMLTHRLRRIPALSLENRTVGGPGWINDVAMSWMDSLVGLYVDKRITRREIMADRGMSPEEFDKPEAGFNPYRDADITGYEKHASLFLGAVNPHQVEAIKRMIDARETRRENMELSGTGFFANLVAGVFMPENLFAGPSALATRTAIGAGLRVGAFNAAITAGTESVRLGTDPVASVGEMFASVGFAGAAGFMLGSGFHLGARAFGWRPGEGDRGKLKGTEPAPSVREAPADAPGAQSNRGEPKPAAEKEVGPKPNLDREPRQHLEVTGQRVDEVRNRGELREDLSEVKVRDTVVEAVAKRGAVDEIDGVTIKTGPTGRTYKDGTPVLAFFSRDTNTVHVDVDAVLKSFEAKPWRRPAEKGVDPLPDALFKSADDWLEFVLRHEVLHSLNPPIARDPKVIPTEAPPPPKEARASLPEAKVDGRGVAVLSNEWQRVPKNAILPGGSQTALDIGDGSVIARAMQKRGPFAPESKAAYENRINRMAVEAMQRARQVAPLENIHELPYTLAQKLEARDAALQKMGTKLERDHLRLAATGVGLEKIRWDQMPWYLMVNNGVGGEAGRLIAQTAHELAASPGLRIKGVDEGLPQPGASVETMAVVRGKSWTLEAGRAIDQAYFDYMGLGAISDGVRGDMRVKAVELKQGLGQAAGWLRKKIGRADPHTEPGAITLTEFRHLISRAVVDTTGEWKRGLSPELVAAATDGREAFLKWSQSFAEAEKRLGLLDDAKYTLALKTAQETRARLLYGIQKWERVLAQAENEGRVRAANKVDKVLTDLKAKLEVTMRAEEQLKQLAETAPKTVRGENWLHRIWRIDLVRANPKALEDIFVAHWLERERLADRPIDPQAEAALRKKAKATVEALADPGAAAKAEREARIVETRATIEKLASSGRTAEAERLLKSLKLFEEGKRNPADFRAVSSYARIIDVPTEKVMAFIETDVSRIMDTYSRKMGPVIEATERFGDPMLIGRWNEIQLLALDERAKLKSESDKKAFDAELARQYQALTALRDRVLGLDYERDPTAWSIRSLEGLKSAAIMSQMGRAWQVALIDGARTVFTYGAGRVFKSAINAFMGEAEAYRKGGLEVRGSGEAAQLAQLHGRFDHFLGAPAEDGGITRGERVLHAGRQWTHFLNLLAATTDVLERFTGAMAQSDMVRVSLAWVKGAATEKERRWLLQHGIDEDLAKRFAKEWESAGAERGGRHATSLYLANTNAWNDLDAVLKFRSALVDITHSTIIHPGAADRPLFMSKSVWNTLLLYKGFAIAATQRIAMAGLQQRDARVLAGVVSMIAFGGIVDMWRDSGHDERGLISKSRFLRAVELSGVLGIMSDVNNIITTLSGNEVGLGPLIGAQPIVKNPTWADKAGAVFGAAVQPWMYAAWAFTDQKASADNKARAIARLVPFNNLWAWNSLFQSAQRDLGSAFKFVEDGKF